MGMTFIKNAHRKVQEVNGIGDDRGKMEFAVFDLTPSEFDDTLDAIAATRARWLRIDFDWSVSADEARYLPQPVAAY